MIRPTWPLRLLLVVLPLAALAVSASPQAHLVSGSCSATPAATSAESIAADAQAIYVARADGRLDALGRNDGRLLWSWPSTFEPDAGILSVVADGSRVYLAVGDVTNHADDPVVALDKATGAELWRTSSLRTSATPIPADPFRLALDRTDASDPYLYVGMNGGDILKLERATGRPLLAGDGSMARFHPPENDGSPDPNGIYALEVAGGKVFAARDWGNLTRGIPVQLVNFNNTLLYLNRDLTPAADDGEMAMSSGNADRIDGIFALWYDTVSSRLYAAGSSPAGSHSTFHLELVVHELDLATSTAPVASTNATALGFYFVDGSQHRSGYVASALSLSGDATHVYVGTQTNGGDTRGHIVRLNKDLSVSAGWAPAASVSAGGVRAIQVTDDAVIFAHECSADQERLDGSLVVEWPKDVRPTVVVHKPQPGLRSDGSLDLALRPVPATAGAVEQEQVAFWLRFPDGHVARFHDLGVDLLGLQVTADGSQASIWRGVVLPPATVPDGTGYRIRADTQGPGGASTDWAEGTFTIDRRAPDIEDIVPSPLSTLTSDRTTLRVALRDLDLNGAPGTLVDPAASHVWLNGVELKGVVYESNGLHADVGTGPNLGLRQGINDLRLDVRDRAGNLATRSWTLRLDHEVAAPTFVPGTGFVNERRPILQARVPERVSVVSAVFNGTDVTAQVARTVASDGTTSLQFRPASDLSQAFTYEWRLVLRDDVGNQNDAPFRTTFRVDESLPEVRPLEPLPDQLLIDDRPKVRFSVGDPGSGLVSKSVSLHLDGVDRTRDLLVERDTFTLVLAAPLLPGVHHAVASAADLAGNVQAYEWSFRVDLDSPKVVIDLVLPTDQAALKQGDRVLVRVTALDDSTVRSVRLDGRALDPARGPQELVPPVPGRPGVYEANLTVKETRTLLARVAVTVDDHSGHQGLASADVRVDNNAPITVLEELPAYVGGSFELRWRNEPPDEAVGGSGVAYYRLEQQVGTQEWRTIRPRLSGTDLVLDVPEGAFRDLHYRVVAVDKAGNVQRVPSNVASTVSRGDPFTDVRLPGTVTPGQTLTIAATAVDQLELDNGLAFLTLSGSDGANVTRALDAYGRLYMTSWNFTDVPSGDYVARLHFRASDGFELASASRTLHVADARLEPQAEAAKHTPSLPPPLLAASVAALALALRRRSP